MLNTQITQKPLQQQPEQPPGVPTIKYGGPDLRPPVPPAQQELPDAMQQWEGVDQMQKG